MIFEFHADIFEADEDALRVGFAQEGSEQHYFVIQRDDDSIGEVLPNLKNIYIERDDQCWGGYGGILQIACDRNNFSVSVDAEMANQMGGYETLKVFFSFDDAELQEIQNTLKEIMQGYESRLKLTV